MITVRLLDESGDGSGTVRSGGPELIEAWKQSDTAVVWVDLEGEATERQVAILEDFGCHELSIKDALRDRHPPKIELFEDHTYVLFRGISAAEDYLDIEHLQISLFVGDRYLLSRHKNPSLSINFWAGEPNLAQQMAEPLVLAIKVLHYSAGKYLELLLDFEERLSDLEDVLAIGPSDDALRELTIYKTRLMKLKRIFDYHQSMVMEFPINDDPLSELAHLRQDLFERCERLYSLSAMYYEICGDLVEGNLSLFSHQMNQAMRVLTVITAVFVPLSFIAGLYGMNFEHMPELHYADGYFFVLGFMVLLSISLVSVFRWKKWL